MLAAAVGENILSIQISKEIPMSHKKALPGTEKQSDGTQNRKCRSDANGGGKKKSAPKENTEAAGSMPNQREIASMLGISQSTISLALRGSPSISADVRQKVQELTSKLGYHPNAYVNVLMTHIRSGKRIKDEGVIAMLIDAPKEEWNRVQSFKIFHDRAIGRGEQLGFHVETFFLNTPGMDLEKIGKILHTRNIQGVIMAPPYRGNRAFNLHWDRYAAVGVGFGWEQQELDRVGFDTFQNYVEAFDQLWRLGYRRIGTVLESRFIEGTRCGLNSFPGYLLCQQKIPRERRIPIFQKELRRNGKSQWGYHTGTSHLKADAVHCFQKWMETWQPDALLTLVGEEQKWLDAINMSVPQDIGLACLAQPINPAFAHMDERSDVVGATAVELVISKIARNEYGFSAHPKVTMVQGVWTTGKTVRPLGV